jgi:chloride channel protein, CIC family
MTEPAIAVDQPASQVPQTKAVESTATSITAIDLLKLSVPAFLIGVFSAILLAVVTEFADKIQNFFWDDIPDWLNFNGNGDPWIIFMLTLTGVAVGWVVLNVPGHAGPDPATTGLVSPPLAPAVLPGLAIAMILMLAGGVSLGPENPIMAINIGICFVLGTRYLRAVPGAVWVGLATAGMIGAMFGTPVAAALVLSETISDDVNRPLWDRLFAPILAAGAGALTMDVLEQPNFSVAVAPYPGFQIRDWLYGSIVACIAALLGLVIIYAFPQVHSAFHRVSNPVAMITLGGFVLGILGAIGGSITLFKGLAEMKVLTANVSDYSNWDLFKVTIVKLLALLIAASCGFRGGRIFPSVFVGVALGLFANAVVSDISPALAVSCGVLGIVLAITRLGWLSLFLGAIVVPFSPELLPVLCVVLLPAWLVLMGKPEMQIEAKHGS